MGNGEIDVEVGEVNVGEVDIFNVEVGEIFVLEDDPRLIAARRIRRRRVRRFWALEIFWRRDDIIHESFLKVSKVSVCGVAGNS